MRIEGCKKKERHLFIGSKGNEQDGSKEEEVGEVRLVIALLTSGMMC